MEVIGFFCHVRFFKFYVMKMKCQTHTVAMHNRIYYNKCRFETMQAAADSETIHNGAGDQGSAAWW